MDTEEITWLAGLLEGEGTFGTSHVKTPTVRIILMMTDRDVVQRAAKLMDAPEPSERRRMNPRTGSPYKVAWVATVSGNKAVQIMNDIHPYMGERRSARISELISLFTAARTFTCRQCGKAFQNLHLRGPVPVTCSDECHRLDSRRYMTEWKNKRRD